MILRKIAFFQSLFILLLSCSERASLPNEQAATLQNEDSIKREIPRYASGRASVTYQLIKEKTEKLNLNSLENGYDSLQIRVWFVYAKPRLEHLIIIKKEIGSSWDGQLYNIIKEIDSSNNENFTIKSAETKEVKPNLGWEKLIDSLMKLRIHTLPDQKETVVDGNLYAVEVATAKTYRFYTYTDPYLAMGQKEEARKMELILKLLQNQLTQ